ncbi:hypothetical protein PG991_015474 [Apiospora marii]|uniref:CCHC-type domain-containing protein n=1 Tax=Apiospora marii TaxID=335849 RepID=A0ABR1R1S6_9PEZI
MTRSRGCRGGKGSRKGPQKEASDGQRSTKDPRRAQGQAQGQGQGQARSKPQSQSDSRRVSLPPRPPPVHESHQDRLQGADHRVSVPITHYPLPSEPEPFHRDYNLRNSVQSPILPSQPHDPWVGHGYVEVPRDEHRMNNLRAPAVDNPQLRSHEFYRQRTPPEYRPYQQSEITQMRPSFEGRGPPSSRLSSDVRHRHSRSMSPVAGSTRSSGNPGPAAAHASVTTATVTRVGEPCPDHVGDEQKKEPQQTRCGNCKREGHKVKDCVSKIGATGYIMACPRCNTNKHLYERCPSPHAPAIGTRQREEDDLYYLLTCRQNKPQIRAWTDLAALVRWTTPSLAAFPWTPAFALRYHEDPTQAAAERDYDYGKHDFGPGGGGRRPDREALMRRFDPSHPAIPKTPVPTMLVVPATPQEIESHQRTVAHDSPALVDTVMSDTNARAEAMGVNSGKPTYHPIW